MALRFCDSFDHYSTLSTKWDYATGATIASGGRFSTNCLSYSNWSNGVYKTIDAQTTWVVGYAFKISNFADAPTRHMFGIFDGDTSKASLYFTADGRLTWSGVTSSLALATATWYYLEFKVVSSGVSQVRVNGATWIDTTIGSFSANRIVWGLGTSNGCSVQIDDIYVCDGTGSVNKDFLGDIRVQALLPSGTGNSAQWSRGGTDSGSNYGQVDESTPNDETDYIYESTASDKDTYAYGNLSTTTGTIIATQWLALARKDDAGTRTIAPVYRPSSTDYDGTTITLGTGYTYQREILETSPATSSGWTISEINGAEFGVKLVG